MTRPIPTEELSEIRAGDTLAWDREDLSDYPASEWTLTYTLINKDSKETITATANGDLFRVSVSAAITALYQTGTYKWIGRVAKSGEEYTIGVGTIEVLPDLEALDSHDTRSLAKKNLDNINAVLLGSTKREHTSYSIAGRALSLYTHSELVEAAAHWEYVYNRELASENADQGRGGGGNILFEFDN